MARRLFRWLNDTHIAPVFTEIALGSALFLIIPVSIYAATYQLGAPGVSITGSITVPEPAPMVTSSSSSRWPDYKIETFEEEVGHWGASGPSEIMGGVFKSSAWSYDNNHLSSYGGAGMLHLLAYADHPLWNYTPTGGSRVSSDFTNALITLRARGVNFSPNGSQFIVWVQAWHPTIPGKFVNWGYVAEPRTSQLASGSWEEVVWQLDPDPTKWVWGKGEAGRPYDEFASLEESLRNVHNVHLVMLGPDNVGHPTGSFELDTFEISFNRNGPRPVSEPPAPSETPVNIIPLMTAETTNGVKVTTNGIYEGWRIASYATLDGSTFQQWNSSSGWVFVEFPSTRRPTKYAMTARPGTPTYAPKSWNLRCWLGNTVTILDTKTNVPAWSGGERREYTVPPGAEVCDGVEFSVSQSQGGSYLQWVRPELFALPL